MGNCLGPYSKVEALGFHVQALELEGLGARIQDSGDSTECTRF